jgi:hypothetical protein
MWVRPTTVAAALVLMAPTHAALGQSMPQDLSAVGGSRLAPIFLTAEDDSRQLVGWFDTMRGESCAFVIAADGVLRCLPTDGVDTLRYSDPSCNDALVALPACSMARYAIERETSACGPPRHHVRELAARIRPQTVYVRLAEGCARVAVDPSAVYVKVGRPISPVSFVAAQVRIDRAKLSLKTQY